MSKKRTKKGDFIEHARYPGGDKALMEYILANLQYPEAAILHEVEGTVHVDYQVNQKGQVFQAKALTKLGHGLEEEAIRLAKSLKFIIPQKVRNLKIVYNKHLHIHFRLPVAPPVQEGPTATAAVPAAVEYTIVPSPARKEIENEGLPKPKVISYQIKLG